MTLNMDGNGGCCIARWTDEGHVAAGYDMTKMDMIMLKFRPIAPKPVSANGTPAPASDSSSNSPRDGRHAARGRRKNGNTNNNKKKRKSSSPDNHGDEDQKGGVTLLPLFPEAPDLTPTTPHPSGLTLNNDNNIPVFEDNYRNCHW